MEVLKADGLAEDGKGELLPDLMVMEVLEADGRLSKTEKKGEGTSCCDGYGNFGG